MLWAAWCSVVVTPPCTMLTRGRCARLSMPSGPRVAHHQPSRRAPMLCRHTKHGCGLLASVLGAAPAPAALLCRDALRWRSPSSARRHAVFRPLPFSPARATQDWSAHGTQRWGCTAGGNTRVSCVRHCPLCGIGSVTARWQRLACAACKRYACEVCGWLTHPRVLACVSRLVFCSQSGLALGKPLQIPEDGRRWRRCLLLLLQVGRTRPSRPSSRKLRSTSFCPPESLAESGSLPPQRLRVSRVLVPGRHVCCGPAVDEPAV